MPRYCHVESEAVAQRCLVGGGMRREGARGAASRLGFTELRSFTPSHFFIAVVCPPTCEPWFGMAALPRLGFRRPSSKIEEESGNRGLDFE